MATPKTRNSHVSCDRGGRVPLPAGCNTAGDAFEALNGYIYWLLEQAAKRAKSNGRKTVRGHDFMAG